MFNKFIQALHNLKIQLFCNDNHNNMIIIFSEMFVWNVKPWNIWYFWWNIFVTIKQNILMYFSFSRWTSWLISSIWILIHCKLNQVWRKGICIIEWLNQQNFVFSINGFALLCFAHCFFALLYFGLKFHNWNVFAKHLVSSKQSLKFTWLIVYLLLKRRNDFRLS